MAASISPPLICTKTSFLQPKTISISQPRFSRNYHRHHQNHHHQYLGIDNVRRLTLSKEKCFNWGSLVCDAGHRNEALAASPKKGPNDENVWKIVRALLWGAEAVYILWLFLLPYAPGDPVWAISSATFNSLVGLSLNFFLILPFMNAATSTNVEWPLYCRDDEYVLLEIYFRQTVGINLIEAPVLHPALAHQMSEGLFNFVIGWTFLFAPLLFTDRKRDRYKGSLDVLWGFQMFLTNTFLIPYMAIRLNKADAEAPVRKPSKLESLITNGAPIVGPIGGAVCVVSALWALYGRMDGNFGNITDRWEFLISYIGSERLAYAFIWDICLYTIFQPWLIGENLQNVKESKVGTVKYLRFVPVVGLVVYLLYLNLEDEYN